MSTEQRKRMGAETSHLGMAQPDGAYDSDEQAAEANAYGYGGALETQTMSALLEGQ